MLLTIILAISGISRFIFIFVALVNDKNNLSAYIDRELAQDENIRIKKLTISNPDARKCLEQLYKSQKIMQLSYEKTKSNSKFDYSKKIMAQIVEGKDYTTVYFKRLILLFCILIAAIISGFIYLYF